MGLTADVLVAGGGVIGAAIAWRAAADGHDVVLADPGEGDAAALVAAGMLAPVSEALFGEDDLLALNLLAVRRFPSFAAELESASGREVGLRREGTLAVAYDPGDHAALARLTAFRRSLGLDARELDSRDCRQMEPFLAPDVRGGYLFEGDWSVDNRRYLTALREAAQAAGARLVQARVSEVQVRDGKVCGAVLDHPDPPVAGAPPGAVTGGAAPQTVACRSVVVAAGHRSGAIAGVPAPLRGLLRPVKGQLLRLRVPAGMPPVLSHTIRATVRGFDVYLVPRADGELVVGATQEELGPDRTVTAGAVHDLLRDAMSVVPVISELMLAETAAGLRPGTPDNGPLFGGAGPAGMLVATGHYRNGVLLSAATAEAAVAWLAGAPPAPEWAPFGLERFAAAVRP